MPRRTKVITWLLPVAFALTPVWSQQPTRVRVTGINKPIEIVRDLYGVPHIYAMSEDDALFALGYVHAQDRLWEMEYQRRVANGRLAEVLGGQSALSADRLFRTIGVRRAAVKAWANSDAVQRRVIGSYTAGVNAYLSSSSPLPLEFQILGYSPEPWTPEDSLAAANLVSWGLDGNWTQELLRSQIALKLGPAKAAQLTPAYTNSGPVILSGGRHIASRRPAFERARVRADLGSLLQLGNQVGAMLGTGGQGRGSNNWVLSGARTTTSKPVLAGDPHLSTQTPALFYVAHLSAPGLDVFGATLPGSPGVVVGQNNRIAWALTTANVDVQDLYLEHVNANNEAEFMGSWEPLELVGETIKVKGAPDVHLRVRISRHGPLISDAVNPTGPAAAFRWTAMEVGESLSIGFVTANRAQNVTEFLVAFRDHRRPAQNILYADRDGNIGYLLAADIPIRAKGDGSVPAPGWTGEYEWTGYIPFSRLPQTVNPPQGFIVTANNKPIGDDYPYTIGTNYAAPYRASRIIEMVQSRSRLSPDDMTAIQTDVLALHARELLPMMLAITPANEQERKALDLLRGWDLRATEESSAAAVFEAWYTALGRLVFADELGDGLWQNYSTNIYMVGMALPEALRGNGTWCDNVLTPAEESCAATMAKALTEGLKQMTQVQNSADVLTWRWGVAHSALFPHNPFDKNADLQSLFSRKISHGGDKHTVNVGSTFQWDTYDQLHGAIYRQVIDLSDAGRSRFMITPGQSGDPHSPHYDDLLPRWQRGDYIAILSDRAAIDREAVDRLVLEP